MNSRTLLTVDLACHPETPADSVESVSARVGERSDGTLTFRYAVRGDISRLRVPEIRQARAAHELWKHTCLEAFVRRADADAYYEFNFAPSTEWARYSFERYREGMTPILDPRAPTIIVRNSPRELELDAVVRPVGALLDQAGAKRLVGLAAVIEHADGRLSYWALKHPSDKPDFHHPDNFALEL